MPAHDLDAIFYVEKPPRVEFRDGMFRICFDIGKRASFELAMSPNTFLKMRRASGKVADEFHEGARVVSLKKG